MPLSIKVNLRVTGHCNQGGRKYMEDMFSVAYQQTSDDKDLEYAFFGIFDGHGGGEAATFAKEHLMDIIVKQRNFWSDKDEDVLRAIRDGYVNTHYAMWRELEKWPRTASGLPSTAGTTASVAFIRKGKIYIGHVGDSGIILGYQEDGDPQWKAKALTKDHKPESGPEMIRIQESGGKVVSKSGVPRVVWNRPRIGHRGPVRRSTHIDEIPFLAVARSLGDLWSYNSELDTFVVSPEPDVRVVTVDVKSQRCLIFGTDGLWNMLTPQAAVAIVQAAERHNEKHLIASQQTGNGQAADVQMWINPSKSLVDTALERWFTTRLRADNTSVVTLMLDPPGPSRSEVLMSRKNESVPSTKSIAAPLVWAHTPSTPRENIAEPLSTLLTSVLPMDDEITKLKNPNTSDALYDEPSLIENGQIDNDEKIQHCSVFTADTNKPSESISEPQIIDSSPSSHPESIQVAEISSSDTLDESQKLSTVKPRTSIGQTTDTMLLKILPTAPLTILKRDITPSDDTILEKPTLPGTRSPTKELPDPGVSVLVQQNTFCGSCEQLQSGPRLSRTGSTIPGSIARTGNLEQRDPVAIVGLATVSGRRKSQGSSLGLHLESRSVRRRQSINTTTTGFHGDRKKSCYFDSVGSRLKRDYTAIESIDKHGSGGSPSSLNETTTVGSKRRHSSTSGRAEEPVVCTVQEPTAKRRTRSEDRPSPTDENHPVNHGSKLRQKQQQEPQQTQQHSRLRWPEESIVAARSRSGSTASSCGAASVSAGSQEKLPSPNSFQRRSLEKKATPVKTIRRPSINGSSRVQLRGSFALREWDQGKAGHRNGGCSARSRLNRTVSGVLGSTSDSSPAPSQHRWLRSDTLAATPVKTLRSRNVDITGHTVPAQIAHQYGIVKQNRLSLPAKLKLSAKVTKSASPSSSSSSSSSLPVSASASTTASASASNLTTSTTNKLSKQGPGNMGTVSTTSNTSSSTGSVITKRVKSPYNPNARSALGTRSRLKRLGK